MGKRKVSSGSSGPKKAHGPKKHMHSWAGPMKWQFGKTKLSTVQRRDEDGKVIYETKVNTHDGLLSKYSDYESWQQACSAKGKKSVSREEFKKFYVMSEADQKAYFENLGKKNG